VMDTETGQVVTRLDTAQDPVSGQVNNNLDKRQFSTAILLITGDPSSVNL
jgi:hypothetical protein